MSSTILLSLDPAMPTAKDNTHASLTTDHLVLRLQLYLLILLDPIRVIETITTIL